MDIDPFRLVAFVHVVLFAYWLGADLGVMLTSLAANRKGASDDARIRLREAGTLIDMAPRTCLVLMVPVGLTLAQNFGSPITGPWIWLAWVIGLAWLWLVWMVHFKHNEPLGKLFWKIDFALRTVVMVGFLGFGAWCLATDAPIASNWLATKFILFGVLVFLGIMIRIILVMAPAPVPGASPKPAPGLWSPLRLVVFAIWGLVFVMAFLGVVKPF